MVKVLKHIHIPNIVKKKSHKIITFWRNKQQKCFWAWIRSTLFLVVCYEAFLVGFLSQQMILQNQENIAWLTFLAIRFISDCMLQYKTLQVHIKRRISLAHTQENKKCTFYISTHLNLNKNFLGNRSFPSRYDFWTEIHCPWWSQWSGQCQWTALPQES